MSTNPGSAAAFRIPSPDPTAAECTSLTCEVGAIATEPGFVIAVVLGGIAALVAFAYLQDAKEECHRERRRVIDERDAFEEFADRVSGFDPAPAESTSTAFGGPTASVRRVDGSGADDIKLRRVLAAYRNTVMSLPHYTQEYDETISESLAAELGPDTAASLASNGTLSAGAQSALVTRSRKAAEARSSLADAIAAEIDRLTAIESDLNRVDRRRRRLLEHLDGVTGDETDAAIDVWRRLDELEGDCEEIATERQRSLDDPPMTPDRGVGAERDRAFYEYLYAPVDGPDYPVLAQVSELAERLRTDRDRVASRLAGGG